MEEVEPRYKSASPPYYCDGKKDEKCEQRAYNFELSIHYVIEQEVVTHDIKMSRGVEPIPVTKQETIILSRVEPIIVDGFYECKNDVQ